MNAPPDTALSPPRLHIALVTETYPPEINGVAMTLGRMVEGLLARGHRLHLLRPRQSQRDAPANGESFSEALMRGMKIPRYEGLRFGLPARNALVRIWSAQRPDLVHVATEGPLGWSAVAAARRLGLPVTSDYHTRFDQYSAHYGLGWLKQPVATYLKRFHNRSTATFVPSQALAQRLREDGYKRVEVIARGVDCARFTPQRRSDALRREWSAAPDALVVMTVGRLAPEKNLALTLKAFAAIRGRRADARLVLVGDGPARAALQAAHPEVIFAGMRSGEDLAAHYASADLFLFPSLSETFGNVTLEAMASSLPVVAFDYAAAQEVIRSGEHGLLATPADEAAFVTLALAAADDAALRARLGRTARLRAETLDWETIHSAFSAALLRAARPLAPTPQPRLAEQN